MLRTRSPRKEKISNCYLHSNSLSNKMDNSLLAVRDINHKYIVVERSDRMAINNTLKDIRLERNLIQEDLAEATGSCSRTIGRIERGERNPSLEMAIRLAHYLNVNVEDIFQLDDDITSGCKDNS